MEHDYLEYLRQEHEEFIKTIEDCQQLLQELKQQKATSSYYNINRAAIKRYRLVIDNKLRRFE